MEFKYCILSLDFHQFLLEFIQPIASRRKRLLEKSTGFMGHSMDGFIFSYIFS